MRALVPLVALVALGCASLHTQHACAAPFRVLLRPRPRSRAVGAGVYGRWFRLNAPWGQSQTRPRCRLCIQSQRQCVGRTVLLMLRPCGATTPKARSLLRPSGKEKDAHTGKVLALAIERGQCFSCVCVPSTYGPIYGHCYCCARKVAAWQGRYAKRPKHPANCISPFCLPACEREQGRGWGCR